MTNRYAAKVDANHADIRDGLRQCGFEVLDLSRAGEGVPDLLVRSRDGHPAFLEIKSNGGRLTPAETRFAAMTPGLYLVVYSLEEALERLNEMDGG